MKCIYAWIRKLYIIIKIFTWEIIQLTCLILKKNAIYMWNSCSLAKGFVLINFSKYLGY